MANDGRRGTSIRIFLADGAADGLKIVEKSNWTGRAIVCPRSLLTAVRAREEFSRPGVYVLVGPSESGVQDSVYVGQADVARDRLDQHVRSKDFWTHVVLFTSKDENLNKAHVQFLESRLISLAAQAKRARLDNGNTPGPPNLSEADRADMESFLADMLLIYPLLGITAFDVPRRPVDADPPMVLNAKGVRGEGRDTPEGFLVLAGTTAVTTTTPSLASPLRELHARLIEQGVLLADGDHLRLGQDYVFTSPSTAASVLLGRSTNGRLEWKTADGRALRDVQQ